MTRRFLASYAPATAEDLTRWRLGPPRPTIGARMIARLGDEAVEVEVDGRRAWVLADALPAISAARADERVVLLPGFDPWVIGAARHAPSLDAAHQARVFRPQGWISPVILVGGRIVGGRIEGVWRHMIDRGGALTVELEPSARSRTACVTRSPRKRRGWPSSWAWSASRSWSPQRRYRRRRRLTRWRRRRRHRGARRKTIEMHQAGSRNARKKSTRSSKRLKSRPVSCSTRSSRYRSVLTWTCISAAHRCHDPELRRNASSVRTRFAW